jgi:anti-sigma factor RsiW
MTDEELISEYLDGRLGAADAAGLERRLAAEPGLAARLRVLRAMKDGLRSAAVPTPAALKARLKAAARAAAPEPSWRLILREAFAPRPCSFAAATAFAAAVVLIAVRGERPQRPVPPPAAPVASPETGWSADEAQRALAAELWSDDEGGDDDAL